MSSPVAQAKVSSRREQAHRAAREHVLILSTQRPRLYISHPRLMPLPGAMQLSLVAASLCRSAVGAGAHLPAVHTNDKATGSLRVRYRPPMGRAISHAESNTPDSPRTAGQHKSTGCGSSWAARPCHVCHADAAAKCRVDESRRIAQLGGTCRSHPCNAPGCTSCILS